MTENIQKRASLQKSKSKNQEPKQRIKKKINLGKGSLFDVVYSRLEN